MTDNKQESIVSAVISPILWIVSVPLVLLRAFGVLFFADTISGWAIVPAIVIVALLVLPQMTSRFRRSIALSLLAMYLGSVYFHGWRNLTDRLAGGRDFMFDAIEAALILALVSRCVLGKATSTTK